MHKKLKIGFFGDGLWSHRAIEKISENKDIEILFIVPRFSSQDPTLYEWSKKLNIDFIVEKNINSNSSIDKLGSFGADLFVSMSYDQIIKKRLLNLPKKGFINCHAGLLPFYRGRSVLNWVLINGENYFGITVHYIDEGIDTGDIILQKKYQILLEDDYASLLLKASSYCSDILNDSLNLIKVNEVKRIKQNSINPKGSYFGLRKSGDEILNWKQDGKSIINFVRGLVHPGPIARSRINNFNTILISKISKINYTSFEAHEPGTIVAIQNKLPIVKANDCFLIIREYSLEVKNGNDLENHIKIGSKFY